MSIPVLILLLFALWTLLVLVLHVGTYRLYNIFSGRKPVREYSFPEIDQSSWHRRATRAHLNCLENLPVYGALVVVMIATGVSAPILDKLAIVFFGFRVLHSLVHLFFQQSGKVVMVRFGFFAAQVICLFWIGLYLSTYI